MDNARTHAWIILPPIRRCRLRSNALRRWLSRTDFAHTAATDSSLQPTLSALGLKMPTDGVGALRHWGQTARRSDGWIAAADPLYLEARLNHLFAHRLGADELPVADLDAVYAELNSRLGRQTDTEFSNIGRCGYLRSDIELHTPIASPEAVYGADLTSMLPKSADAGPYHRLHSEVQMALHEARVQQQRAAKGLRPVNALWIWGGGVAPAVEEATLPILFGMDPLLRGYWYSRSCSVSDWCGSVRQCAERAGGSFVAEHPDLVGDATEAELTAQLDDIKILLDSGRLDAVTMLFRDGVAALARRPFRWRWWRPEAPWLRAGDSE